MLLAAVGEASVFGNEVCVGGGRSISEKVISLDLICPFQIPEDEKGLFLVTSVLVGECTLLSPHPFS